MDSLQASPWPVAAPPPPPESSASPIGAPRMEVAHVLFMDVIGYSKLRMNQQAAAQLEIQNLVNASPEVKQAKVERKFICRPAGDGMALLFFRDIVSPVRTALQIHDEMRLRAADIQAKVGSPLKLRMGIHTGTVLMVEDLNAQLDAAGDGINIAQRVMDCGDADHILVSAKVAESLLTSDPWQRYLTDLGNCRVKHGLVIHLFLLHGRLDGPYYGNTAIPKRVDAEQSQMERDAKRFKGTFFERNPRFLARCATVAILAGIAGGGYYAWNKVPSVKPFLLTAFNHMTHPTPVHAADSKGHSGGNAGQSGHGSGGRSQGGSHGGGYSGGDSGSAQMVSVPDFVNRTYEDAQGVAQSEHLRISKSAVGYNTQYGEGMIFKQSPASGASVPSGTRIFVRVSKGDPPEAVPGAPAGAAASPAAPESSDTPATDQ